MSTETHHESHDKVYIQTALVLALITGIETFTYFKSVVDFKRIQMPVLLVCMVIKFYLIAANFMHLRWEKPILRRVFMTGIGIALAVYFVTLFAFKFFDGVHVAPH